MKATKLIAIIAFAGLGMVTEGAFAQDGDAPPVTPAPTTEEGTTTEPYNETVTIDSGAEGGTGGGTESTFAAPEEKKERLRVYSGKHDGVNVIVDPR
ncbi:MAG: hypothetical protein IPL22_03235 [Bacteroidetes bacterium]|nr:hypothetical protein [Bacteroidota bacterium]